ncbi:MAG: TIGR04454 family lipoprotein [Leptospiraceae bacterium]|nr:TIGR04454 family lipoprotein [Leptospiraceae bacterium]MCK6380819.1 TIGR04454 family lipoprotein [Leptospiraceae bacterium]NUM41910.1 TIGR04454 family lipoprotein [Leptospiraceae bacterium]
MKKILFLIVVVGFVLTMNCKGSSVSSAECEPIVNKLFENLSKELKPEEAEKVSMMKATLLPTIQKECMSGKYDLDCLSKATNIAALQACKK